MSNMRCVELGKSGLFVPVVGQGTGIGWGNDCDTSNNKYIKSLKSGIDAGMTFIDTAEIYGGGHAEALVGEAIRGCRDKVVIATKFAPEHSSYDDVIKSAERSLQRFHTDYIDLYQSHWPNPKVPFEKTLAALHKLYDDGKVRYIGLCNTTIKQYDAALSCFGNRIFVSIQQQYNLADRFPEQDHLPKCERDGVAFIAYSPLFEGTIATHDLRRKTLEDIALRNKITIGQLALIWLLRNKQLIVIPKAIRLRHILDNAKCGELALSENDIKAINGLYIMKIYDVDSNKIDLVEAEGRIVYKTIHEAMDNKVGMTPSPNEVAQELLSGEYFKPIKVKRTVGGPKQYCLVEGRLRYWAWQIAFGNKRRIPVVEC